MSLILALISTLFLSQADAGKKELEKIQGTWVAEVYDFDGKAAPLGDPKLIKFVCKDDKYTQMIGDQVVEVGTHKLDPSKKPKTMDITVTEGQGQGDVQLAIYEIEGDTLKMCAALHGVKERPKELVSKAGSMQIYIVLKREKAKP